MDTQILRITRFEYQKVEKKGAVINIPLVPIYYQEDNHRVLYGIFPQIDNNTVCELRVIKISENYMYNVKIHTHPDNLSDIISHIGMKGQSTEEHITGDVLKYLMDYFNDDRISKELFEIEYTNHVNMLNKITF